MSLIFPFVQILILQVDACLRVLERVRIMIRQQAIVNTTGILNVHQWSFTEIKEVEVTTGDITRSDVGGGEQVKDSIGHNSDLKISIIFAGDFNSTADSAVVELFTK